MTQADRDRLVALKKAEKKLITQRQAAQEVGVSERQLRRMLKRYRKEGDRAVVHGLRGRASNRRRQEETRQEAIQILSDPVYAGFGPTLASEYLAKRHEVNASKETVRKWMAGAGLWQARKAKVGRVHTYRERRERFGELVQWDTSTHDWLEGRGEELYLITMIDDATSRVLARFVRSDSTEANLEVLEQYLKRFGRPLGVYTDKAGLFFTTPKAKRDREAEPLPPTQVHRALLELNIDRPDEFRPAIP
jgi:transposase